VYNQTTLRYTQPEGRPTTVYAVATYYQHGGAPLKKFLYGHDLRQFCSRMSCPLADERKYFDAIVSYCIGDAVRHTQQTVIERCGKITSFVTTDTDLILNAVTIHHSFHFRRQTVSSFHRPCLGSVIGNRAGDNSTQLNEHLWTQVLKHLSVHIYLVTSV